MRKPLSMPLSSFRLLSLMILVVIMCYCRQNSELSAGKSENPITTDSSLAEKHYQLSYLMSKSAPDSAMYYARKSLAISNRIESNKQIAKALSQIAYINTVQRKPDSAIYYFQLSADKYWEIGDTSSYLTMKNNQGGQLVETSDYNRAFQVLSEAKKLGMLKGWKFHVADSYANLGLMEDYQGNVDSSFYFFKNALSYAEKAKDTMRYMKIYNNIGVMFYYAEEYAKSIPYFQKAITYHKSKNDISQLPANYLNLGVSYDLLEKNDSAYQYFALALEAGKQMGNAVIQAKSYQNIGALLLEKGDTLSALKTFKQALNLKKKANDNQSLSNTYQYIAQINLSLGDTLQGRVMLDSAMLAAIFVKSKEQIKECYQLYVEYYKQIQDFQKALDYQEKKEEVKDSLFDIEKLAAIYGFEVENSTKEKEKIIQELEGEKKGTRLVLIIISPILILFLFLLVRRFKKKQKKLRSEKQKLSTESQQLKTEKQEEKTKNKELIHRVNGQFTFAEWYLDQKKIEAKKEKIDEVISDIKNLLDALSSINNELINNSENPLQSSLYNIAKDLNIVASELLNKEIIIQLDIQEVKIKKRDIVYLCTLFNELTMNSIKYAFDNENNPKINFRLEDLDNGHIQCYYHDNGLGYNPKSKSTGKGLGIIANIIENMQGKHYINTNNGFSFKATLKKNPKND